MSHFLMDHNVRPLFNAVVDVDFGPTTIHSVRYTIADYKELLRLYIQGGYGPVLFNYEVKLGASSFSPNGQTDLKSAPLFNTSSNPFAFDNAGNVPDYPDCPFADGIGDPREDADVETQYSRDPTIEINLFNPRTPDADWTTTHVWLPLVINFPDVSGNISFRCNPSDTEGDSPLTSLPTDFIGIDYAIPVGVGIGATGSFSLGDGTTRAYFNDPGVGDRVVTTALTTTNY